MVVVGIPKRVTTVEGSPKMVKIDEENKQQKLRERRERDKANKARKAEGKQAKGPTGTANKVRGHVAGKRPWDDDDGLVAAALGKKWKGLKAAIRDFIGGPERPPFNLEPSPKLPLVIGTIMKCNLMSTIISSSITSSRITCVENESLVNCKLS